MSCIDFCIMEDEKFKEIVQKIPNKIAEIIDKSTPLINNSPYDFIETKVKILGSLIGKYYELFQAFSVKTRKEVEIFWTKCITENNALEKYIDELLDSEQRFGEFLETIDAKLKKEHFNGDKKVKSVGDIFDEEVIVQSADGRCVKQRIV